MDALTVALVALAVAGIAVTSLALLIRWVVKRQERTDQRWRDLHNEPYYRPKTRPEEWDPEYWWNEGRRPNPNRDTSEKKDSSDEQNGDGHRR